LYHISKKEHNIICDYFPSEKINDKKYDLVIAQNVFAHTDNVNDFLKKIVEILSDDGILYIQTSQSNMILNNEFDTIYHEHLSFFNSMSMKILIEKNGLKLNNVFKFDIESIINNEKNNGLYDIKTYEKFAKNAQKIVLNLKNEIKKFKDNDYLIIGYGAAAKGMTVLNFGDIQMDYIIDDNPLKCNLYTPGTNILITDINILKNIDKKILFIPLAWNFYNEIVNKIQIIRKNSNDIFLNYFPDISINNNKI
ncbi:MAG: methyltransferase domain-containing protein, partial [Candidatus Fonsibacter ubiquis]